MNPGELRAFLRSRAVRICDLASLVGAWSALALVLERDLMPLDLLLVGSATLVAPTLGATGRPEAGLAVWRQGAIAVPILTALAVGASFHALDHSEALHLWWLWLAAGPAAVLVLRGVGYAVDRRLLAAGIGREEVILVGSPEACSRVREELHHDGDCRVAAVVPLEADGGVPTALPVELRRHGSLRVVVCPEHTDTLAQQVLEQLRDHPVTVQWAPRPATPLPTPQRATSPTMVDLCACPLTPPQVVLKWIEDKVLALILLALAALPMAAVAVMVKLTSPGPVLFTQERHGLHGRIIKVYKFRSMRVDPPAAERELAAAATRHRRTMRVSNAVEPAPLPPVLDRCATLPLRCARTTPPTAASDAVRNHRTDTDEYLPTDAVFRQTEVNDPRLTPIGSFLRKTSLDELPQIFNVLRGDMSLVGPRPHAVPHNLQYTGTVTRLMRRHYIKPGITGLAQVSGARGATRTVRDMRRRVAMDLIYMRNWSLMLDLRILVLTAFRGIFTHQP